MDDNDQPTEEQFTYTPVCSGCGCELCSSCDCYANSSCEFCSCPTVEREKDNKL